jgi:hypothetical protein
MMAKPVHGLHSILSYKRTFHHLTYRSEPA